MAVRVSGAKLAGAVANAGGIGVISSLGLGLDPFLSSSSGRAGGFSEFNRQALIDELEKSRAISPKGLIGVNILIATRDYPVLAKTAAAHGADLIITGAGTPLDLPALTADHPEVALVPMVCGLEAVKLICRAWQQYDRLPDALIVENSSVAGGHIGTTCETFDSRIEQLIPQIQEYLRHELAVEIPLIAAGGIWDRADIDRMLAIGASGVQVGTRFIATEECDADDRYKAFHLNADPKDVVVVPSPVGKPARALRNGFAEKAIAASPALEQRCIANCLESCLCRDTRTTYCLLQALSRAASGDTDNGMIFSGGNIRRAERLMTVAEVMAELTGSQALAAVG